MDKITIGNWPTPIQTLNYYSKKYNKNIFIKRDDFSGIEFSGNKVRKLEYILPVLKKDKINTVITVGSIQSNHCRTTAALCAKFGIECHLILKKTENYKFEGNYFLSQAFGATIHLIDADAPIEANIDELKNTLEAEGKKVSFIPLGGSDANGAKGYMDVYKEILQQEEEMGIKFDSIVLCVGSGGTYAGLWYTNKNNPHPKSIVGLSVLNPEETFKESVINILEDIDPQLNEFDDIYVLNGVGEGYAKSTLEEIEFILQVSKNEGVLFDPCYTGKAFKTLIENLNHELFSDCENILFIHTGGIFGWTESDIEKAREILTN